MRNFEFDYTILKMLEIRLEAVTDGNEEAKMVVKELQHMDGSESS